jgi:carbonic anhydrase
MGEAGGNVFVHRNVANMVVNNDVNLLSALQYGVAYLKVQDIVVCGHYQCGGIRASESNVNHAAPLEQWLRNIRDVYRLHKKELDGIKDSEARHKRLVELNVIEQCVNVFKNESVQKTRLEAFRAGLPPTPRVHAVVFDPKTGDLKRIPFDFAEYADDLANIYGLYVIDDDAVKARDEALLAMGVKSEKVADKKVATKA